MEEIEEVPDEESCSKDVGNAQQLRGHSRGTYVIISRKGHFIDFLISVLSPISFCFTL